MRRENNNKWWKKTEVARFKTQAIIDAKLLAVDDACRLAFSGAFGEKAILDAADGQYFWLNRQR